uniref:Nuclear receptor domain-containing protein n=1 Tax=Rhabditophanes sp. KR3021 TaxID=114890 RepID=A0AC35TLZ4_9BILA
MTQCVYCHNKVESSDESLDVKCPKCISNEERFGKPTNCKYCKLNAAFKHRMCVYCAASAKKTQVSPIKCRKCKTNCAFPKSTPTSATSSKETVCRLCYLDDVNGTDNCQIRKTEQDKLVVKKLESRISKLKTQISKIKREKAAIQMTNSKLVEELSNLKNDLKIRDETIVITQNLHERQQFINHLKIEELSNNTLVNTQKQLQKN